MIALTIPEMSVAGKALVRSVVHCAPGEPYQMAGVVTGTCRTERSSTLRIAFDCDDEPLGVTALHPLFSVDRNRWTAAGLLRIGERVSTARGTTIVTRVETAPAPESVYSLEVGATHTYYVSEGAIWAHNVCFGAQKGKYSETVLGGKVEIDYQRSGKILEITNIGIEGKLGSRWLDVMEFIKYTAKSEGFEEIVYFAVRKSGAIWQGRIRL